MADPNPFLAFQEKLLQSPKPLTGEAPIEGVPAATTEAAAPDNPFAAFQAKLLQQPAAPAKSGAAQKPATTETPAAPAEAPPNPFAAFQAKLLRQPSAPGEATAPGMTPETLNEPATLADRFTQAWTAPGEGVVGHTWGVLNTPLVAEADIEGWLGNPKEQFGTLFGGIAKGAYELVSGLTSPLSLAFVIGSMGAGALFESGGAAMLKNVGKMAATDIDEVVKGSRILAKAAQLGKTSDEALVAMEASGVNTKVVMDGLDTLKKAGMTSHDLVRGGLVHTAGSAALRGLNMPIKTADSIAKSIQMMIEGGFAAQNVYGAVTAFPSALDAIKEGDVGKAAELITTAAGMAGFGLLGTHALMKEAGGGIDPVLAKMGLHTKPTDENIKLSREWGVHDRQVLERGRAHELWSEALRKDPEFQKILKEGDLHAIFNYVQAGGDPDVMAARRRLVQMSAGREPDVAPENALLAFQADLPDAPRTRRNQPTVNAADPDKVALLDPEAYLGGAISTPFSTYHEASQVKADRNAYVRDAKTPDNTGRALKVQFSSNLINKIVTDTLELEHRTDQPDLTVTDPSKYGTGVPGAEAKRQAAFPEFWVDRTYFTKKDVPVEALMAKLKFTYGAKVPEGLIYDPKVDPKGYFGKAREILAAKGYTPTTNAILTLGEKLMAEGGEGGFAIGDNVALFGPTEVFKKSLSPEELATQYNNKLYAETRPGFARPADFWEVPQWIANASHFLPDSDMYVVRNMEEAKKFLGEAKYDRVLFSALDVNKHLVKELAESYGGRIDAGGYIDPAYFQGNPNIHWHDSMESLARDMGVPYKEGVDYRHFKGSDAILRLNMSKGCLHKCAFCIANSPLELTSKEAIDQQVGEIVKMGAKLVYLNDKTFGQAKNYQYLSELNDRIKKQNPGFHGFVVQTTAAQLGKIPAEWLAKSGIRYVELGVESFNDPLLKEMHKPATEMLINKAVDKLRKNKIALIPNILIGYPGETAETYARTLDFLKHNKDIISHANIFNLALYADAELGKKMTTAAEGDFNENVLEKSWHKDPNIVKTFAGELYGYASNQLDQLPDVLRDLRPLNELTEVEKKHLAVGQRNEVFRNVLLRDPGVKDLIAAAKMGSAGRDWYERSIQAFESMRELAPRYFRPEDADVWAGVVASISPQQSVQLNLRESIDFWKDWVDNGRPKTEEQILKLQRKGKMRHLANQPSKLPNVIRSLNGEDLLPESREQYFKVGNFANALRKYFSGAEKTVFDSWMGIFFGLNETQVGSASFYHAMAVQTRLAARELGWKPEQVQAAVWSFTKTLGEMSGWKSPEFGEYYKPADVLGHMTPEDVAVYSKDFSNLMYSDREIRGRLMQLGVNLNELDKRLKGIPKPAPIEGAVEAGLTESVRRSAERIGKAQQQLVGFDKYSKYQPGTEFDFSKEIESAKPKTETPEFQRWFGDSKIVDEAGTPKVVYHGTQRPGVEPFSEFRTEAAHDLGSHFGTVDQATARVGFSETDPAKLGRDVTGRGQQIYPVYLNIRNPLRLPDMTDWSNPNEWIFKGGKLPEKIRKPIFDLAQEAIETEGEAFGYFAENVKAIIQKAGYDGVVYKNMHEGADTEGARIVKEPQDSYIAFRPEQIKSATGNLGTWDPTNPDIRKEFEGGTLAPTEDWVSPKVPFAVSRMEKLGTIVDRIPNARGNDTAAGLFKNQRGEYTLALSRDQLANFNRITESPRTPKGVLDVARGLSTSTDPTVLNALRNLLLKDADPATVQLGEMLKAAGNNPLAIIKLTGSGPFNTMLYEYVHSELFNTMLHEHVHGVLSDQEAAVVMTKIRHMDGLEQLKNHIRGIEYKGARYSESEVPGELMTRMVAGQLYNVMGVAPEKVDAILWEALNVLPSETAYQKILGNLESGVRNRIYEYIQPEGEGRGVRPELAGEPAGAGEARPGLGAPRAERGPGGVLKRDVTGTPEQQKRADLEKWIRTKAAGYQKEGFLGKTEESALKRVSEDVRAGRIPTELADAAMRYLKPARDPETMEVIDRDHPDFPRTAHIANFLEEQFQRRIPEGNVPGTPEEAGFQKEISDKPNVIDEDVKKVTAGIPGWGDSSANYWMTPEGRIVQVTDHSRSARSVFNSYYDDLHRAGYLRFFTTTDQDVIMSLQRGVDRHVIDKVLPKLDFKPRDFQVDEISPEEGVRPYTFHSEAELKNWMNRSQLPGLDFAKTLQGVNIAKGFTVNPHTGMIPKTGYSLEVVPEWRKNLDHDVTPADISKFAQKNRALLEANPHLFIGGWGRELNLSAVFKDLEDAKAAGKRLDQHGTWDIAKGEDIDVGGKGKQTEFPDYPIPERMAFTKKTSIPLTEAGPLKFNRDLSSGQEGTSDARLQELASRKLIKEKYTEKEIDDLIKAYDPAQLTQAHKNLASKIAVHFRDTLERAQKSGALEEGLEHYVTHMWQKDADNPAANRLLAEARSGRFAVSTSMARHRVFDHAIEGQLLGRKLAVTDPIALAAHNGNTFDRVISARDTLARLRDKGLRASDGRPMVALSGTGHIVQGDDGENPAVIIHPDRMSSIRIADKVIDGLRGTGELDRLIAEQKIVKYGDVKPTAEGGTGVQHYAWATNDYKSVSHPAFEGWKVPTEDTNGNPIILRSDLKVHPDAYDYMKRQLDTKSPLAEALKPAFIAGREAKGILLSFDVFHLVQEGLRAVMTGVSPFGVEKWDLRTNPLLGKLVEHGLTMKDYGAIDSFQEGQLVGHSHLMTKIPGIGPANAWFQDFLFKKYIPGLKARAAEHLFERYKKLYPEYPEEKILQLAATDTNMRFGGLNLRREGRALATQDVFRLVALAPDWLESEIRSMGRAMGGDGRVMRRDLAKVSVGLWLAARVLNQLNTGNAHYEAPFGVAYKDDNGREKVVSLRTLPTDILHAVTDPLKFMRYRTSPLERTLSTVYSGRDEMGRRLPARDLVWDVLGDSVVPLPLQNVVKKMSGFSPEQNWKDLSYRAMGGQVTTFKTEAQKKAAELAADRSESGPIDKDKLREHVARIEVEDNMRSGQSKSEDLFQMVDQGLMSPKDAKVIMKNVQDTRGMDSDLARLYTRASRLPMSDFLDVWELATAGEKSTLTKLLLKKKATYFKKAYTDLSAQQRSTDTTYRRLRQLFPDSAPF